MAEILRLMVAWLLLIVYQVVHVVVQHLSLTLLHLSRWAYLTAHL